MVVDDELVSRLKAWKILSEFGECQMAKDGVEALERIQQAYEEKRPYELLTLDIKMPDIDGLEALKTVREWEHARGVMLGDGVKILMLSVSHGPTEVLKAFQGGCESYIYKPFNRDDLLEVLVKLNLVGKPVVADGK